MAWVHSNQRVANCACARRTKTNEFWPVYTKTNEPEFAGFCTFFAHFWAKNGQKRAKNGRTKTNPGETGRNRKFRRILIWDRHALILTYQADTPLLYLFTEPCKDDNPTAYPTRTHIMSGRVNSVQPWLIRVPTLKTTSTSVVMRGGSMRPQHL